MSQADAKRLILVATDGDQGIRLNLGGGDVEIEGYVTVDRKRGAEVYPLDYPDGSVAEIYASHVLEHCPYEAAASVVKHWVDKLEPGGRIRIAVPDFEAIARRYLAGEAIPIQGYVMGGHADRNDYHHAVFDAELLTEIMIDAGLERIGPWSSELRDCASLPISLNLQGYKPLGLATRCEYTAAVVSVPRYGPTSHQRITQAGLYQAGVPYWYGQGAYWHQVLSEMLEDRIVEDACRYVITLDYDTVATYTEILGLYRLMEAYPAADAIAAMQMKRNSGSVLFRLALEPQDVPGTTLIPSYQLSRNLLPVEAAHFGLTIFRADALRSHPRPWMAPIPCGAGRWGDGRIDADIEFWRRWRDAGRTLFLAPRVVIGHLEEVITWPTRDLRPVHQSVADYLEEGIPQECRR